MRDQTHLTLEPTIGLSDNFALGFMELNAWQPGNSPEFAGWRVLPHIYAPESWPLPFHLGFVAEFRFKTRTTRKTHGAWSFVRSWIASFPTGKSYSTLYSSARCMGQERNTDGISNRPCCYAGSGPSFHRRSNTTGEIESINVPPRAQPEVHQLFSAAIGT